MASSTTTPASTADGSVQPSAVDAGGGFPTGGTHAVQAARWLADALDVSLPGDLLTLALTHRSYAYEHGGLPTNERLEFLGDSVLGLVVTDELYRSHPDLPEGQLAKLRASVVNMTSLAKVARSLGDGGIGPHLLLGRGEQTTGGREKDSILADALEALIGAIHLGRGLDVASSIVHRLFDPLLAESATRGAGLDWKTSLQELGAAQGLGAPVYEVEDEGPDHAKTFTASVLLAGAARGRGSGRTKKAAEQEAAEAAWRALSAEPGPEGGTAGETGV
ncbi:ribonuclease III [Modestobacter roseus]|uniref:Ribonuclease 3 n=1 Tax=Modestobacter roseus TaxID=1181884 RepID=A0A562ISC5_9ACTN|nr:ribonuclease III [Modestobacter roseus]TWH73911.1 ribonuclease-3 [Modestobacter roseus]